MCSLVMSLCSRDLLVTSLRTITIRHRSDATSHSPVAGTCMPCTREFTRTRVYLVCEFARTRISLAYEYSRLASALLVPEYSRHAVVASMYNVYSYVAIYWGVSIYKGLLHETLVIRIYIIELNLPFLYV